ncbi:MAG TPA: DUF2140 family protein [Bacilli bacterium]|nr:DUF2140 family protein [Bacilli bacterium]
MIAITAIWFNITEPHPAPVSVSQPSAKPVAIEATVGQEAINQYVAMQLAGKQTPVERARFVLEDGRVRTDTSLVFFGRAMSLSMWMRPEVQADGDLRLYAEEAKMGDWPLPLKTLFAVLEGLPWPPWVHVQSEQRTLDFNLSERATDTYAYGIRDIDWQRKEIHLDIRLAK